MSVHLSHFSSPSGVDEYYFAKTATPGDSFTIEALQLLKEYANAMPDAGQEVFLRFHLSDISTQAPVLREILGQRKGFLSFVGQAPVNGARIAMEAWHLKGKLRQDTQASDSFCRQTLHLDNYKMLFHRLNKLNAQGSYDQMEEEFVTLQGELQELGGSVADNLHRTWIYCRDIDNNYHGLVVARNNFFDSCNLTPDTHFITSTGIEGKNEFVNRLVCMDSWALFGHKPEQIEYMTALDYLSHTHVYGVAFERGTRIVYGDRSVFYISGTASIDKNGEVLHVGNVRRQTQRTVENICALMNNHGGKIEDLKQAVVYLRDAADRCIVEEELSKTAFARIPHIMVKAPVCRPTWLVEIDAIGVNKNGNPAFAPLA